MSKSPVTPGPISFLVLAKVLLHFATIGLYGFHRDELYLLSCAERLDWGSVDHAPATVALAWLQGWLFGDSPAALRGVAIGCGASVVWLAARCASLLGGGSGAQVLAGSAVLVAPVFLFVSGVHGTNALDQLVWALILWLSLGLLREPASKRRWALLGVATGVGFLNKYTAMIAVVALAVAFLAVRGRMEANKNGKAPQWTLPTSAGVLALLLWLPNLVWQAEHGFPFLDFLESTHAAVRAQGSWMTLFLDQPRLLGLAFVLGVAGAATGFRRDTPVAQRFVAVFFLVALASFGVAGGKGYYLAPAWIGVVALGACRLESAATRPGRRWLTGTALVASLAIGLPLTLPVLPEAWADRLNLTAVNRELSQFADWQELTGQIPKGYPVLTDSYGTAAAIERFGPDLGVGPTISGANTFHADGPPDPGPSDMLVIGYPPETIAKLCRASWPAGDLASPRGHDNRFDFPRPITLCRVKAGALAREWKALKHFD